MREYGEKDTTVNLFKIIINEKTKQIMLPVLQNNIAVYKKLIEIGIKINEIKLNREEQIADSIDRAEKDKIYREGYFFRSKILYPYEEGYSRTMNFIKIMELGLVSEMNIEESDYNEYLIKKLDNDITIYNIYDFALKEGVIHVN